jgi:hypothetical protein
VAKVFASRFGVLAMNWTLTVGLVLTAGGLIGYLVGTAHPYPGRAFSVTAVMIGVTIVAVGGNES